MKVTDQVSGTDWLYVAPNDLMVAGCRIQMVVLEGRLTSKGECREADVMTDTTWTWTCYHGASVGDYPSPRDG